MHACISRTNEDSLSHSRYNSPCCRVVDRRSTLEFRRILVRSGNNLKLKKTSLTKAERMENRMNMQGLLAVLEEDKADLVGRRETRFSPVPLIGVQLEVLLQVFSIMISLLAPPRAPYNSSLATIVI